MEVIINIILVCAICLCPHIKKCENISGNNWYKSFLTGQKQKFTIQKCQNISRATAAIGITASFQHLAASLQGIHLENLL